MRGMVKWFSIKKGYGFIVCEGKDYFVHVNDIEKDSNLDKGDQVSFEAEQAKKGVKAVNVRRIG
ncbi:Cold shock protein CspC [subsurface metagenome]